GRAARRFEVLLSLAREYAAVREAQMPWLTRAWPVLRRTALEIGRALVSGGVIADPEEVFWLRRDELDATRPLQEQVAARRGEWAWQRRLAPPLAVGRLPAFVRH